MASNYGGISAGDHSIQHNGDNYTNYGSHGKPKPPDDKQYERRLQDAAVKGEITRVQRYLKFDIDLDSANDEGRTALHGAVDAGHEDIVRALIEGHCNLDAISQTYGTPLRTAVSHERVHIIKLLLDSGADPNAQLDKNVCYSVRTRPRYRNTQPAKQVLSSAPCHVAALQGTVAILKVLVENGADVNLEDLWERTPLHYAAQSNSVVCLEYLLEKKALIRNMGAEKETPLHAATLSDNVACMQLLLKAGAHPDKGSSVNGHRLSPVFGAKSRESVALLIRAGANIDCRDENGGTALVHHMRFDNNVVPRALLEFGASVHSEDKDGFTALCYAKTPEMVENLVLHGAEINHRNERGFTPLMQCAGVMSRLRKSRLQTLSTLLQCGAHVKALSPTGKTALDLSTDSECVALLTEAGGKKMKRASLFRRLLS